MFFYGLVYYINSENDIEVEITYNEDLAFESVKIIFDVDESLRKNVSGKYMAESEEFVETKRFNVFMFFEEINMTLPVETFHDVEKNRAYAVTPLVT